MREQMHVRIVPMTGDHLDEVAELERIWLPFCVRFCYSIYGVQAADIASERCQIVIKFVTSVYFLALSLIHI